MKAVINWEFFTCLMESLYCLLLSRMLVPTVALDGLDGVHGSFKNISADRYWEIRRRREWQAKYHDPLAVGFAMRKEKTTMTASKQVLLSRRATISCIYELFHCVANGSACSLKVIV